MPAKETSISLNMLLVMECGPILPLDDEASVLGLLDALLVVLFFNMICKDKVETFRSKYKNHIVQT